MCSINLFSYDTLINYKKIPGSNILKEVDNCKAKKSINIITRKNYFKGCVVVIIVGHVNKNPIGRSQSGSFKFSMRLLA